MQMSFAPKLKPFDPADRPKGAGGLPMGLSGSPMALSPADKSGIISHPSRRHSRSTGAVTHLGLEAMDKTIDARTPAARHAQIEDHARQLVSQTFFGTMLKQMRESPFKSELFDGGKGGQAYNQLMDQRLVDQMSRGAGKKLVHSLVKKFEGAQAASRQAAAKEAYAKQSTGTPDLNGVTGIGANRPAVLPATSAIDNHSNREIKVHVASAR